MGKTKKKTTADNVRWKRAQAHKNAAKREVQKNPFEVHINKQKHKILGRKSKHDVGLPGVSRSKAIKKRKETLLIEYKNRDKNTLYKDARFGENDMTISVEDKMLERYAIEHKKKHKKMDIFNLNNSEELTHMGESLSDAVLTDRVENDTTYSDDEQPIEQFGGMFTRKQNQENDETKRLNVIDEIIAKSKKEKYEKQVAKDKSDELREKLDGAWGDVRSLLSTSLRTQEDKDNMRMNTKQDNYDIAIKQMMYDRKVAPSFRAKSEEEMEKERKEELAKSQAERLERMNAPKVDTPTHKSADQLCMLEKPEAENIKPVVYGQDGRMIMNQDLEEDEIKDESEDLIGLNESGFKEGSESDDDDGEQQNMEDDEEADNESDEDGSDEDAFSDLEEEGNSDKIATKESTKVIKVKSKSKPVIDKTMLSKSDEIILKQMLKCPSGDIKTCCKEMLNIAGSSKSDCAKVFRVLWNFAYELGCSGNTQDIDALVSDLYAAANACQIESATFVQSRLKLLYDEEKSLPIVPTLGNVIELKLIKLLWCTSDFRHPVVTSALVYIGQILYLLRVKTLQHAGLMLLLSTLAFDYVSFSKRYVPEVIYCLSQLLHTALSKKSIHKLKTAKETTLFSPQYATELLHLDSIPIKDMEENNGGNICHLLANKCNGDPSVIKVKLFRATLRLSGEFIDLYSDLPAFREIFSHINSILTLIETEKTSLPEVVSIEVQETLQTLNDVLDNLPELEHLTLLTSKRPKMLKMLDPEFEENVGEPFQKRSNKASSRAKKEHDRLQHKYRREIKGAVREIRKDAKFLASEKLNEQLAQDAERAAKVKRLYGLLANQEGDVKRTQRKKFKLDLS